MVAFGAVCEFLVPFLIVSRDPERVLELLLPSFRMIGRPLEPLTRGLLHLLNRERTERRAPVSVNRDEVNDDGEVINGAATSDAGASDDRPQEERKLLKSIVDFGDTLVREVMTPRPDIVAIPADATLDGLRALFREQEYSRIPVFRDNLDNILGLRVREGSDPARRRAPGRRADHEPSAAGPLRSGDQASSASCCANSSISASRAPSWWTSTAAPPVS